MNEMGALYIDCEPKYKRGVRRRKKVSFAGRVV